MQHFTPHEREKVDLSLHDHIGDQIEGAGEHFVHGRMAIAASLLRDAADKIDPDGAVAPELLAAAELSRVSQPNFPQPKRNDGGEPCGECHLQNGETCDICGAIRLDPGSDEWLKRSPNFHPGDIT